MSEVCRIFARETNLRTYGAGIFYITGIGGSGSDLRCKTRTLTAPVTSPDEL